jgi:hypothetical protein
MAVSAGPDTCDDVATTEGKREKAASLLVWVGMLLM